MSEEFTDAELKVLYAFYKHDFAYDQKKKYGIQTTEELERIVERLKSIDAIEPESYNKTMSGTISFGNGNIVSDYGKAILREYGMLAERDQH